MKVNKIIKSTVEEEVEITGATLLSVEEAENYLTAEEKAYTGCWWLRSPGRPDTRAAYVERDSYVDHIGFGVDDEFEVRPALEISNLKSSNFEIGDTFEIDGYEFKVISDNLAWMYKQDIGCYAFNEDYEKGNNYETSDIKKLVDEWFERLKV